MITLDAARLTSRSEAHEYLREALAFPEYYGKNLDALFDCLTDLDETTIRFVNIEAAGETYFSKLLPVFQDAEAENSRLHLTYDFEEQ